MEANKIKKALEYCKSPKLTKCDGCPRENEDGHCMYRLNEDALALINLQEQKIKELTEENERLIEELAKSCKALDESMNFYCSFTQSKVSNCPIDDEVVKAKADTVRKMQDMVAVHFGTYTDTDTVKVLDVFRLLGKIAEEILEDDENGT